jgi:hypothetical protein
MPSQISIGCIWSTEVRSYDFIEEIIHSIMFRFLHHTHVGEIFATHQHENGIHDVWKILREGGVFDWFFQYSQHDFSIFIQVRNFSRIPKYFC